jgi:cytochrome c biogenesis protein CcmG, thiol:disulfide interchange protein DsbE
VADRPEFTHKPERHGLVGPFSGRQLGLAAGAVVIVAIVLVAITTPLGNTAGGPGPIDPRATAFLIGSPPAEGLRPGSVAPELATTLADGSPYRLQDLDGRPIRLADLRGKVVWLNFWATWCPPCQHETPILRDLSQRYRSRGLEIVGISVQETSPDDIRAYATRYQLPYTIGFDGSGYILHAYRVYALPTQFFIDTSGVIRTVVNGPVDAVGAAALIESMLPTGSTSAPASPSATP